MVNTEDSIKTKLFRLSVFDDKRFALTFYKLDSLTFDEALERVRLLPERRWSHDLQCWLVPFSAANIEQIRQGFDPFEYDMDEEASVVMRYAAARDTLADKKALRRWNFIFNDVVPSINFSPSRPPYKHQTVALDALHNTPFFALLMEMGTGKTKVIIDEATWQAKTRLQEGGKSYKVLIVCPRSVQRTWLQEIRKDAPPDMPYWAGKMETSIRGMKTLLEMATARVPLKFVITNYEKLGSMGQALKAIKFDLMVLDESTKIKTPSTHRTKNALEIGESCSRRVILTGAPVTNNILDLFSQFEFLENGILGFSNFHQFKWRFARIAKLDGQRIEKVTGWQRLDELKERVARHSFIVRKDQCLDLPPKNYETRYVEMTEKQAELYEQMLETFLATLTDYSDPDGTMKAQVVIVQLLRLAQICCGYMKTVTGEELPIPGDNPKIEALMDIIEQLSPDAKLLVWARFHHDVKTISQALTNHRIGWAQLTGGLSDRERDEAVDLFNGKNHVRVLIGEPGTGGYGLTLLGHPDNPCYTVVYYSNDFSLEKRMQSEDRVHRIGQTRPVTYIDIVCENTVEERIAKALQEKRALSEMIKDVQSIKDKLLGITEIENMSITKVVTTKVMTDENEQILVSKETI